MTSKQMSLKAKIKQIAKEENVPAQIVLQNFVFEKFFARLSKSKICANFILKGGTLISQYLGLSKRTTMDIDLTLFDAPLSVATIEQFLDIIFKIEIDDGFIWNIQSISPIRNNDLYGGFRVKLRAQYDDIVVPFSIDISTGDAITPSPKDFIFMSQITPNESFRIKAYTIETVIAEKLESIFSLGALSTRPRDYYDAFMLLSTVKYDEKLLKEAIIATVAHRGSNAAFQEWKSTLASIKKSNAMNDRWDKYQREFSYANGISFNSICEKINSTLLSIMPIT